MRSQLFVLTLLSVSFVAVGCCHRHGSYDPTTGLVYSSRCGLFDTCGVGCFKKSRKCKCKKHRSNCRCQTGSCCDQFSGGIHGQQIIGEGGFSPHGGQFYSEGQVIYGGGTTSDCPECQMNGTQTYHSPPSQGYPELMVPQGAKPVPAPAAETPEPQSDTSISIPPVSYSVPQSLNGPAIPQLQQVSAF